MFFLGWLIWATSCVAFLCRWESLCSRTGTSHPVWIGRILLLILKQHHQCSTYTFASPRRPFWERSRPLCGEDRLLRLPGWGHSSSSYLVVCLKTWDQLLILEDQSPLTWYASHNGKKILEEYKASADNKFVNDSPSIGHNYFCTFLAMYQ